MRRKPVVLMILDGCGHSDNTHFNAVANAKAPIWENLWVDNPSTFIATSGEDVGLPDGQMGNSEVGHNAIGAGQVYAQGAALVADAIAAGALWRGEAWQQTETALRECYGRLFYRIFR
mgnify:CR=1 FL=1